MAEQGSSKLQEAINQNHFNKFAEGIRKLVEKRHRQLGTRNDCLLKLNDTSECTENSFQNSVCSPENGDKTDDQK
jgi:hypothetical protein